MIVPLLLLLLLISRASHAAAAAAAATVAVESYAVGYWPPKEGIEVIAAAGCSGRRNRWRRHGSIIIIRIVASML